MSFPSPVLLSQRRRGIPGLIKANARALFGAKGGAFNATRMLDQSPLNSGTRRTGENGRCCLYDGVDDYSVTDTVISLTGDFSLSWRMKTDFDAHSLSRYMLNGATSADRIFPDGNFKKLNIIFSSNNTGLTFDSGLTGNDYINFILTRASGILKLYINGSLQTNQPTTASTFNFSKISDPSQTSDASYFDIRVFDFALTQAEVNFVKSFGETGTDPGLPVNWWKCDEQSGAIGYDSVGGNNLTHTNITSATFHATQDIWSFQNQVGFNTSGAVYIPRDESDTANDVLGNPLTNTGRRPNDAEMRGSSCLTADGTLYIAAAHLAGTETVVSSGGTSTPSISAGRIDFTAGTCWDLTLSDGTHYKLAEGYGTAILDASGSGKHGVLTSATLASAWGGSQSSYHSNLLDGHSRRMYWIAGGNESVKIPLASNFWDGGNTISLSAFKLQTGPNRLFERDSFNGAGQSFRALLLQVAVDGKVKVQFRHLFSTSGEVIWTTANECFFIGQKNDISITYDSSNVVNDPVIVVNGVVQLLTENTPPLGVADVGKDDLFLGNNESSTGAGFGGVIYDVAVGLSFYNGSGNTDADWIYTSGNGSDGTVVGSPDPIYIPAGPDGLDVFGNELTEKPSDPTRNRAETTLHFNPDDTPEMGADQLGITVPTAHAFGDAFAASTQIFSRQRTKTEDRFAVMPEAQSGDALSTLQNWTQA